MASNTLKDLNSLPLTEKMSDCKASLAKPCVGKMNGPLLPSSVALPPSVGESEKPEAEKATVEVEYIESENFDNVDDADAVLKVFFFPVCCLCVMVFIKISFFISITHRFITVMKLLLVYLCI